MSCRDYAISAPARFRTSTKRDIEAAQAEICKRKVLFNRKLRSLKNLPANPSKDLLHAHMMTLMSRHNDLRYAIADLGHLLDEAYPDDTIMSDQVWKEVEKLKNDDLRKAYLEYKNAEKMGQLPNAQFCIRGFKFV